jgi:hypothetical protein
MSRQLMPARKSTKKPLAATRMAVPRSGWRAINSTGSRISARLTASCFQLGGRERAERYQAIIIGVASFTSSEGWKRMKPRSSQRWAPLPTTPMASTRASMATPAR